MFDRLVVTRNGPMLSLLIRPSRAGRGLLAVAVLAPMMIGALLLIVHMLSSFAVSPARSLDALIFTVLWSLGFLTIIVVFARYVVWQVFGAEELALTEESLALTRMLPFWASTKIFARQRIGNLRVFDREFRYRGGTVTRRFVAFDCDGKPVVLRSQLSQYEADEIAYILGNAMQGS